jgi:hypothetical protein
MFDLAPAYYLGGFLYKIILESNHTQRTESDSASNVYTHYRSGFCALFVNVCILVKKLSYVCCMQAAGPLEFFTQPFYHGNVLLDLSQENYENLEDTESIQNFTQ